MKKIKITCDNCEADITSQPYMELGSGDKTSFRMQNSLDNRKKISMDVHTDIHFCSKECFVEYFFKVE